MHSLNRRLEKLERSTAPKGPREVIRDGKTWIMIGRGLLVPPQMTIEEWEAGSK